MILSAQAFLCLYFLAFRNAPCLPFEIFRLARHYSNMCMHTQSCLTLCDPMDCSPPGSFVHGISQARILEWVTISFSRGCSWPRDWSHVSYVSALASRFFKHWATWEAPLLINCSYLPLYLLLNSSLLWDIKDYRTRVLGSPLKDTKWFHLEFRGISVKIQWQAL